MSRSHFMIGNGEGEIIQNLSKKNRKWKYSNFLVPILIFRFGREIFRKLFSRVESSTQNQCFNPWNQKSCENWSRGFQWIYFSDTWTSSLNKSGSGHFKKQWLMKNTEETKEVPDVDEIVREELRNESRKYLIFLKVQV